MGISFLPPPGPSSAADLGLGNVDNTSDLDKPISTDTQTALDGKVDTSSSSSITMSFDNGSVESTLSLTGGQLDMEHIDSASSKAAYFGVKGESTKASLTLTGLLTLTPFQYSVDFAALNPAFSNHRVSFEPTTDVEIDSNLSGNIFIIQNECGAAFDVIAASSETFNGAGSFTINDGATHLFISSHSGIFKVL